MDDDSKDDEVMDDMELEIDRDRLNDLVAELTEKTAEYTVDDLEDFFYHLLRIIYKYSSSWDRSLLVKELIRTVMQM